MKRKDFERILKDAGYQIARSGGHTTWTNAAGHAVAVPHGNEMNKMVVKRLLKEIAKGVPAFVARVGV